MAGTLIFSENPALVLELATAALEMDSGPVYALVINNGPQAEKLSNHGLAVLSVDEPGMSSFDTAGCAQAVAQTAGQKDLSMVLLSSDRRGKELAGRVAEAMHAGCLTDVKGFSLEGGQLAFTRNSLGGATLATQAIKTPAQVVAVSPRAFAPIAPTATGSIEAVKINVPASAVKLVETRSKAGDTVDLQAAERLVVVGQGVEDQSDLALVEQVAQALKAEIGCSKPVATDKKWYPEERIIGLSGKICKPALALILGVSGQVQFTVGVREAQVIVSVNNDENAFMNKIADYVLVADLKEALPELVRQLG
ncbi:MAG: electron transfer flavoprotein subunit alpha/FixB family protein [Syntrophomonadaceae bacterium]|nr:electron transfer flavoprotein subunit alpha/FixB family protein [Syntrophomonadaceae bacterium]